MPTFTTNYDIPKPNVNSADDEDLWGDQLNAGMDIIDQQMKTNADAIAAAASVFTGCVLPFAGTAAPAGFLLCYGQQVSRATYAALYAVTGDTYGAGDGVTTFNLPDLRGRVVAGQDDMGGVSADRLTNQSGGVNGDTLGAAGGLETHTLLVAEMPSHTHSLWQDNNGQVGANTTGVISPTDLGGSVQRDPGNTGGGGAHNNVQPTFILNYVIKT